MKKTIGVFIVDDSCVARELLVYIIEKDPDLFVAGKAENGQKALQWLENNTCDVMTIDIHMPTLNGFEVIETVMSTKPIPTVIISAAYTEKDTEMAFKAMEVGALAILERPLGPNDALFEVKAKEIRNTIKLIAEIKTVTRRKKFKEAENQSKIFPLKKETIKAVAIGASLGGPIAIATILKQIPFEFPVPIFIVQHISKGFTHSFIEWLQEQTPLKVKAAEQGEIAKGGIAYVAIDGHHLTIKDNNVIALENKDYENHHCPSVGRLFSSMAKTYRAQCVGIILTGMGKDGAIELLEMKNAGAYTIAQDEESCIMFGMPKEAITLRAVQQILPLSKIGHLLNSLV